MGDDCDEETEDDVGLDISVDDDCSPTLSEFDEATNELPSDDELYGGILEFESDGDDNGEKLIPKTKAATDNTTAIPFSIFALSFR
ncbi:MAG: hypothetical protein IJD95_05100 [Clostridia bacterium]|nr:hypothetical protein [Clostridia bacterium]